LLRAYFYVYAYPKIGVTKGKLAPKDQKLRPKAENKGGLLGENPVAGTQPRKQTVFRHENPLKMHTLSINIISFTAEMHCIC